MKSKGLTVLFIMLFILALVGLGAGYFLLYNPTVSELTSLKSSHEDQTTKLNTASAKVSDYQQKLALASKKIDENELDISKLNTQVKKLNDMVGDLDNKKRELLIEKKDLETQKQQLESARKKLLSSIESSEEERLRLEEELKRQQEELEKLRAINNDLAKRFETEVQTGDIIITRIGDRLVLEVSNKILFEVGSAEINEEGKTVLKKVAEVIKNLDDKLIQIAGHTDNTPISGSVTNWELASARAVNVVKLLQSGGVSPTNMYAASFGEYEPRADNSTAEGRALNRRIDIQIIPKPLSLEEAKKMANDEDENTSDEDENTSGEDENTTNEDEGE